MKKALITGITGQDGSYLAELLLVVEWAPLFCAGMLFYRIRERGLQQGLLSSDHPIPRGFAGYFNFLQYGLASWPFDCICLYVQVEMCV